MLLAGMVNTGFESPDLHCQAETLLGSCLKARPDCSTEDLLPLLPRVQGCWDRAETDPRAFICLSNSIEE